MARLVKIYKRKPFEIQTAKGIVEICCCGLSKNFPFCDGMHKKTIGEEEEKTYIYHEDGTRSEQEN